MVLISYVLYAEMMVASEIKMRATSNRTNRGKTEENMHYFYFNAKLISPRNQPFDRPYVKKQVLHPWQHSRLGLPNSNSSSLSLSVLSQCHLLKLPLKFWSMYSITVSWLGFIEPQYPLQFYINRVHYSSSSGSCGNMGISSFKQSLKNLRIVL